MDGQCTGSGGGDKVGLDYYINSIYKGSIKELPLDYESDLRYLSFHSGDFIAVYDDVVIQTQEGDTLWTDDFETYEVGSWPSNWVQSGNADAPGNEVIDSLSYSGNKALQLKGSYGGCWESIAYRDVGTSKKLIIEFSIYPTGTGQKGCHSSNGGSGLRTGPDWTTSGKVLIGFNVNDMHIYGPKHLDLGPFSFKQWYRVKIIYSRP